MAARGLQPTTLVSSGEGSGQVMMDRSVDRHDGAHENAAIDWDSVIVSSHVE